MQDFVQDLLQDLINDEALRHASYTKDSLLVSMRKFIANRPGADEPEYGVFTLDNDQNDLDILGEIIDELRGTPEIRPMFKAIYANVNGEQSECLASVAKYDEMMHRMMS